VGGAVAVILMNTDDNRSATVSANWTDLGLKPGQSMQVRDLVLGIQNGTATNSVARTVEPHDVVVLKLTP
jgi:hypothetical protein